MNNTRPLRIALLGNALFSTASGLVMLIAPDRIAKLLGIEAHTIFMLIGAGLLLFAVDLTHQATRPRIRTWRALYASAADLLWVLASVAGLIVFADNLPLTGFWAITAVALLVLVFAAWQLFGIERAHRVPQTGSYRLYRHCLVIESTALADALWTVVRDLGKISRYTSGLRASMMLNHQLTGVGAIRRCVNQAGAAWSEKCTAFNDSQHYFVVRFLADEPGFPFPVSRMDGGWHVQATANGSTATVWWELVPKSKLMAPLLLPLLAWQVDRDFPRLIARMTDEALGYQPGAASDADWQHSARLLTRWC